MSSVHRLRLVLPDILWRHICTVDMLSGGEWAAPARYHPHKSGCDEYAADHGSNSPGEPGDTAFSLYVV